MTQYSFNISLSVLNHLGRNLYRSFLTVLGEAISNAWDADADNVYITIDSESKTMSVKDDGIGMNPDDFQNKFLKIGYSKRKNGAFKTQKGRPFIGRKGIGKLALLSCAQSICVVTKADGSDITGGVIDNTDLDKAISDDVSSQDYSLKGLSDDEEKLISDITHGTLVIFRQVKDGIVNTIEYIKKALALYFRFSLLDNNFNIYLNGDLIDASCLSDLSTHTEFVWILNDYSDDYVKTLNPKQTIKLSVDKRIKGFIATVEKPSNLKIRNTDEKVSLDLFVNGRMRERDLLRHIPSSRIVENYTYGQMFFDNLDDGSVDDFFTSSREGITEGNSLFQELLDALKKEYASIIEKWDELRREYGNDGDPDNLSISPKQRKAQELYFKTIDDFGLKKKKKSKNNELIEKWEKQLSDEATFNIPSYTECFISENLLRHYLSYTNTRLPQDCINEANTWKSREKDGKQKGNISIQIRQCESNLFYLDMGHLAKLVDKKGDDANKKASIGRSADTYKPLRDAVGHTSLLTKEAKNCLTNVYDNIKARLIEVLDEFKNSDDK